MRPHLILIYLVDTIIYLSCNLYGVVKEEVLCRIAMVCWGIWKARNVTIFRSSTKCYGEIVAGALSYYDAFIEENEQCEAATQQHPSYFVVASLDRCGEGQL